MNTILLQPTYFPSISHYVAMVQSDAIIYELEDNFQKQTNRNRMYIYSPNGLQMLNIPIKHSKEIHQKTKEVKIEYDFNWQKQHFKSLDAAYRSSPYFEYFEDDFHQIFEKKYDFLVDLNFKAMEVISKCLGIPLQYEKTTEYFSEPTEQVDFRHLANGKKDISTFSKYTQVFDDKHGFINNLSILDLLFNEGRSAKEYLRNQILP
jgi:hypothetical protein